VAPSFSPLDDELALLPGALTPTLHEGMGRLGASLPCREAAALVTHFTGVAASEATVRRRTEAAGATWGAAQAADVARLAETAPAPPPGPAVRQLSVDGAMVPRVGGAWGEVKLLAMGEVTPDPAAPEAVRTTNVSYVARRAEVGEFVQQALGETHRRGVETAERVVWLVDGGVWCQEIADTHRPDALRVLDFPHVVEHLTAAAEATFGAKTTASQAWVSAQAHELKHGEPAEVMAALSQLPVEEARDESAATAVRDATGAYVAARWAQIQDAEFRAQGLPIGSGAVESGHKRVVLTRMKGAGMRWAPKPINPMGALRGALCNARWAEAWAAIVTTRRAHDQARRADRRATRRAARSVTSPPVGTPPQPLAWLDDRDGRSGDPPRPAPGPPKRVINGRPTAAHPWKRTFQARPSLPTPVTKL
jgi:hypothetical protein